MTAENWTLLKDVVLFGIAIYGAVQSTFNWRQARQQTNFQPYGISEIDILRHERALFALITQIEAGGGTPQTESVVAFKRDETLEELVQAIRRDAEANKPQAALDRLRTHSMKKFAYLLEQRAAPTNTEEPLHSRVGRYVKLLEAEMELRPVNKQIMKNCTGIFQSYNDVRNSHSFAHDHYRREERGKIYL